MTFPKKEFLDLQLSFAQRVSAINDIPLPQALFEYTSLPIRFGMPFSELNPEHPIWVEFLKKLESGSSANEVIFAYHLERMQSAPPLRPQFGCFSYDALTSEKAVRLHFANNDTPEPGVLSHERIAARVAELKTMFKEIKQLHPDFTFVISSSWLFNVNAFTRLFPAEFTAHMQPKANDYRSLGIWGQFLDKYNTVKPELRTEFMTRITTATNLNELADSFPLKELKAESDISYFYREYGIWSPSLHKDSWTEKN